MVGDTYHVNFSWMEFGRCYGIFNIVTYFNVLTTFTPLNLIKILLLNLRNQKVHKTYNVKSIITVADKLYVGKKKKLGKKKIVNNMR